MRNDQIVKPGFGGIRIAFCVDQEILQIITPIYVSYEKEIMYLSLACALNLFLMRVVKSSGDSS